MTSLISSLTTPDSGGVRILLVQIMFLGYFSTEVLSQPCTDLLSCLDQVSAVMVRILLMLLLAVRIARFSAAQSQYRPYAPPDVFLQSTNFLNHSSYVTSFDEPQWYLDNIPFVDFPDASLQQIYYYRTSVLKRHLVFTHEGHGWVFTEFIQPVPWASKFQTIPDSAPHQLVEARWLRDPSYVNDVVQHYTRGGVETIAGITYTHYLHRAFLEVGQATGDTAFLQSQLEGMIYIYALWNSTRDNTTGLYHRTPLLDAQEFSLPGYVTGSADGGHVEVWNSFSNNYSTIWLGPETYRPDFNAYMVAGARAIASVAQLASNSSIASTFNDYATHLYTRMNSTLYSNDLQFWIDVVQGTNLQVEGRELIGLYPYRFDVGTEQSRIAGIEASLHEDGFLSSYGPTTLEQSSPYFTAEKNISYCCLWNGQSWPFSTCVYLGTLARLARENGSEVATQEFFYDALTTYTNTHYDHGLPAIFESHYPHRDAWSGYTSNHSEHYLHSTYIDNIFTNLIGIIPDFSDTLVMKPLIPQNWTHFIVEDLPYHGTLLTIVWDQSGSYYTTFNHSVGLSIYSNGSLIHTQPSLSQINVTLPSTNESIAYLSSRPRYINVLVNPNSLAAPKSVPYANATDTFFVAGNNLGPAQSPYKANDGLVFYDNPPDNYWTNNQTYHPASWLNFTLPRARTFDSVTIAVYEDASRNGSIACPDGVYVYVSNSTNSSVSTDSSGGDTLVLQQTPWSTCLGNSRNTLSFNDSVTADTLSLYLVNALHYAVAIAEVEIWIPANTGPIWYAADGIIGYYSQGNALNTNGTVEAGGVKLGEGGLVEVAGVRNANAGGGMANVTLSGFGGSVVLGANYLGNTTVNLPSGSGSGNANITGSTSVQVSMLPGDNVFTFFQQQGEPWLGTIEVH